MKRVVGILSTAIVPVFIGALAFAGGPYGAGSEHPPGATSGTSASGFMGEHTMTGRITAIDKDKEEVTVASEGKELKLHFPKSTIQGLNKGEEVTVSLGIKRTSGTAGTRGMPGTGMPEHGGTGTPGAGGTESPGSRY